MICARVQHSFEARLEQPLSFERNLYKIKIKLKLNTQYIPLNMRFSTTALVLGTLAAGQAVAASISHYQGKVHNHAERHADLMKAHQ